MLIIVVFKKMPESLDLPIVINVFGLFRIRISLRQRVIKKCVNMP
jgi:hypothetical protein